MFDLFRSREKSVRILLGALLGVVAISMLLYLIPGGPSGQLGGGPNVVASVGDEKITATDVQRAVQNMTRGQQNLPKGIIAMYMPMILNQLIEAKAMAYKAREMGLAVSDQELGDIIEAELAPMMGGKFDLRIYQGMLAQQGMTDKDYEQDRREALLATRLENLESQSLIVTDAEAKAEYRRKNLKIGLEYVAFDPKEFASKVNKDPAAVKAFFEKHRSEFRTPEKRDVVLIVGNAPDFVQSAKVSEDQLKREYQDNIDSYRTPERVQVRHILIKTQGKPKEDAPKLKAKTEDLLRQIQAGADFAKLAKENSEDTGSGQKGGELGYIVRGQTVPNFEKAAFSLNQGQTSGVIETEYGYHIVQVESKQPAHTQSFEEVRPQLLAEAQKQAGAEDLRKAMDAAHTEILRNPGQAEAVAQKYNLKATKLSNLTSSGTIPDVNNAPEVMNAIFAAPKGGTTQVVELSKDNREAMAIVTNVYPAKNADFEGVQADVTQRYVAAESTRLSQDAAKSAAEKAHKGESLESIAKECGGTVKTAAPFTIDGAAEGIGSAAQLQAAFKSNPGDVIGPVSTGAGQFVCKVSQKLPADMALFAQGRDAIVQSLTQQRQQMQQPLFRESVVQELTRRGKIKRNEAALQSMQAGYQS